MSTRTVVRDEFENIVCSVIALAPEGLPAGRAVVPGTVRVQFGPMVLHLRSETATELGRQLLNAATIAQGVGSIAA
jgi:hypothetical protein